MDLGSSLCGVGLAWMELEPMLAQTKEEIIQIRRAAVMASPGLKKKKKYKALLGFLAYATFEI